MNDPLVAATYLMRKVYTATLSGNKESWISNLNHAENYIHNVNFQVCYSGTFKDEALANPWAIYPIGKACVEVPWWYALSLFVIYSLFLLFLPAFMVLLGVVLNAVFGYVEWGLMLVTKFIWNLFQRRGASGDDVMVEDTHE